MERRDLSGRSTFNAVINDDAILLRSLLSQPTDGIPAEFGLAAPHSSKKLKKRPSDDSSKSFAIVDDRDDSGATVLHLAASFGSSECTRVLLEHGANMSARDVENGWTPLHRALYCGNLHIACVLLQSGAILELGDSSVADHCQYLQRDVTRWHSHCLAPPKPANDVGNVDYEGLTPLDLLTSKLKDVHAFVVRQIQDAQQRVREDLRRTRLASSSCTVEDDSDPEFVELESGLFAASNFTEDDDIEHARPHWPPNDTSTLTTNHNEALASEWGVFTCAMSFGKSNYQLGYATTTDVQSSPRLMELQGDSTPLLIGASASKTSSCLLTSEGVALVCGVNVGGRLAVDDVSKSAATSHATNVVLYPTPIPYFVRKRIKLCKVSLGERHSLAVDSSGTAWAWGDNRACACGVPNPGYSSVTKAKTKDAIHPADALPTHILPSPVRVEGALKKHNVVDVCAGADHSIALTSDGVAWSWGLNSHGQLGQRDIPTLDARDTSLYSGKKAGESGIISSTVTNPRRCELLYHERPPRVSQVIAADVMSFVVTEDGGVFEAGRGVSLFRRLTFDSTACGNTEYLAQTDLAAHYIKPGKASRARDDTNIGAAFGFHRRNVSAASSSSWHATQHNKSAKIVNVSASRSVACAVDVIGGLWVWLADCTGNKQAVSMVGSESVEPIRVSELSRKGINIVQASAGRSHILARSDTGDVYRLAEADAEGVRVKKVPLVKRATHVVAADDHSIVLTGIAVPGKPLLEGSSDVVPSLQNVCEKLICDRLNPLDAVATLEFAHAMQLELLGRYTSEIIFANLDWYLQHHRSRTIATLCEIGASLREFQWMPARSLPDFWQRRGALFEKLNEMAKLTKRYYATLMRPTAIWRGQHHSKADANFFGSDLATDHGLPPLIAAATALDVAQTRTTLFPVHVADVGLRDAAALSGDIATTPSTPSAPTKVSTESIATLTHDTQSLAPTFKDAFEAIRAARGDNSQTADAEPSVDESAALRKLAAEAAASRIMDISLPSSAPTNIQACLDRVAAYLLQINRAPQRSFTFHASSMSDVRVPASDDALTSLPLQAFAASLTTLVKRVKLLRKKLLESTQLASQMAKVISSNDTTHRGLGSFTPDQFLKVGRRCEILQELWILAPYIVRSFELLSCWSNSADTAAADDDASKLAAECRPSVEFLCELNKFGLTSARAMPKLTAQANVPAAFGSKQLSSDIIDNKVIGEAWFQFCHAQTATPTLTATPEPKKAIESSTAPSASCVPASTPSPVLPVWKSPSTTKGTTPLDLKAQFTLQPANNNGAKVSTTPIRKEEPYSMKAAVNSASSAGSKPRTALKDILEAEHATMVASQKAAEAEIERRRQAREAQEAARRAEDARKAAEQSKMLSALKPAAPVSKKTTLSLAEIQKQQEEDAARAHEYEVSKAGKSHGAVVRSGPITSAWGYREKHPWKDAGMSHIVAAELAEAEERRRIEQEKEDAALALELQRQALQQAMADALHSSRERGIAKGVLSPQDYARTSDGKLVPASRGSKRPPAKR